jgi:PqqD family protein of HPr-rel-A system
LNISISAWAARDSSGIHLKEWNGEFVVYSELSATTHLLAPATAAVLLALIESPAPLTIAGLRQRLELEPVSGDPATKSESESAALAGILNELEHIELIEAVGT